MPLISLTEVNVSKALQLELLSQIHSQDLLPRGKESVRTKSQTFMLISWAGALVRRLADPD